MNDIFTIGSFCFRLICPAAMALPENFLKFRGGRDPRYTYTLTLTDRFPEPRGRVLARREDLLLLGRGSLETRYIGVRGNPVPYACYEEISDRAAGVYLAPDRAEFARVDPAFVSLLALERRQADLDALILHCAYVEYRGGAILFTAPSGTGKSTQANLWEQYREAETVNGDRALVQKTGDTWYARGWPVCGSSGICRSRDLPIRAVVVLAQAPEDRAEPLAPIQAFTRLYSEITVNRWNRAAALRAMELTEDLAAAVPVFHLACTMEHTAVEVLEQAMEGASGSLG